MAKVQKYTDSGDRLQAYPKGDYELLTAADNPTTALIDLAIESLQGRPPKYSNDDDGLQLFQDRTVAYFRHLKAVNENADTGQLLLPDIESWAGFLQITRQTIWHYRQRGDAWENYIDRVKTIILAQRKDAATRFKCPPMVYVFDAVNNFDYVNTNQIQLTTEVKDAESKHESAETIMQRHSGARLPEKPDFTEGTEGYV